MTMGSGRGSGRSVGDSSRSVGSRLSTAASFKGLGSTREMGREKTKEEIAAKRDLERDYELFMTQLFAATIKTTIQLVSKMGNSDDLNELLKQQLEDLSIKNNGSGTHRDFPRCQESCRL